MPVLKWLLEKIRPAKIAETASSQLWLNRTLDLLPKPFFLLDRQNNRISFSNAAARRMLGMEYETNPAPSVYQNAFTLYDRQGTLVPVDNLPSARTMRGEKIDGEEFQLVSRAGRFNIKVFSQDLPSMYGQEASALIIFQDITSLKTTEANLRQAQADLKEAVEIAQVGFWSVDVATNEATLSAQLMKQFGLTDIDRDFESALAAIHPEDQPAVRATIAQSIADGSPYRMEYRVIHPDGRVRWIEAKSGSGDKGVEGDRFTGTTLDITERVKARLVLEASERDLRRLADSMPQIVWSANPGGDIDYFNQIWFDYCGSGLDENQGEGWTKYVHEEDLPQTMERWSKAIATKEPYENEFRLRNKDGEYRWHVARARPILSGEGEVEKWYGTNTDIHEQKLLSEKLEEARAVAERANSAKSQFLANMSHEIRTPLGAIMGFSELIKDSGLGQTSREEYVSVIERNSSQLLRIIDDILDLSKVEAGMMLIENIEFSLLDLLNDFSALMGFKAREKGIRFHSKAVTGLPSKIVSDPTRLRQILTNVVGNAIKFTEAGHVELRVRFDNDYLEIEVEDTGRGISPEQEVNLFQSFSQADTSTTRKFGGTGLGLVLTRRLSEAMGGHFVLKQSQYGSGSTFAARVKAPACSDSELLGLGSENVPTRTVSNQGQLAGVRILLVEDSLDNQALISIYLGRAGAEVDIASDGEEGVRMSLASNYHVVLMDVQMPVMDGVSAVKKLREKKYSQPIVALTAHAMKEERLRCINAGFTDFLSKPVNREDLINVILAHRPEAALLTLT